MFNKDICRNSLLLQLALMMPVAMIGNSSATDQGTPIVRYVPNVVVKIRNSTDS